MKKSKNDFIVETLINKMFEIAGHTVKYEDIKDRKDNWYQQYTMTEDQNKEWKEWGINFLKKQGRILKSRAPKEMAFFDLMYGLKIQYDENK